MLVNINLLNNIHTQNKLCCIDAIPFLRIGVDKPSMHRAFSVMELGINTVDYSEEEIWTPVIEFETICEVSSIGNIRTVDRWTNYNYFKKCNGELRSSKTFFEGALLTPHIGTSGYYRCIINSDGRKYNRSVHRLIAQAFIPNPENKPQVNHINGIKIDNRVENLEWATRSENIRHAMKLGLIPLQKTGRDSPYSKQVLQIDIQTGDIIREFDSLYQAAASVSLTDTAIASAIKRCGTSAGYNWQYKGTS